MRASVLLFAGLGLGAALLIARARSAAEVGDLGASRNLEAFLALIRRLEANGRYDIIAGWRASNPNDPLTTFSDFSEHPFVLDPSRLRPLGTTASGAYQMVKGTWIMARDALDLPDFSQASQDRAARWILEVKRPAAYPLVLEGRFHEALEALRNEWEAFARILDGSYPVTLAQAEAIYTGAGGAFA